ncbi:hypothetical protein BaRGS_00005683, partial [Batillaria attramentaria]
TDRNRDRARTKSLVVWTSYALVTGLTVIWDKRLKISATRAMSCLALGTSRGEHKQKTYMPPTGTAKKHTSWAFKLFPAPSLCLPTETRLQACVCSPTDVPATSGVASDAGDQTEGSAGDGGCAISVRPSSVCHYANSLATETNHTRVIATCCSDLLPTKDRTACERVTPDDGVDPRGLELSAREWKVSEGGRH